MMDESNSTLNTLPMQSITNDDLQDLMCQTYFDNLTNSSLLESSSPASSNITNAGFEAQLQALIAANTTNLGNSSQQNDFTNYSNLQWKIENESVSSPEHAALFAPDLFALSPLDTIALSQSLINSPHSYTTGDELNDFSGFDDSFDQLLPNKMDIAAAMAQQAETSNKCQTVDENHLFANQDNRYKIKKRKASNNANAYKNLINSPAGITSKKKQCTKDEPVDLTSAVNTYVQTLRAPLLGLDSTTPLTDTQGIFLPSSPSEVPSNFNTTAFSTFGQGVWPGQTQTLSPSNSNFFTGLNNADLQNGLMDRVLQLSNLPVVSITRDESPNPPIISTLNKLPINRLKPVGSQPSNNSQSQPNKQQKKVAHNAIERRYRNNINDRINDLKNVVPALCHLKSKDNKDEDEDDEVDGIPAATKLNKATILRKATEYIIHLKKNNQEFKDQNEILKKIIAQLPGGIELYNTYLGTRTVPKNESDSHSSNEGSDYCSGPPLEDSENSLDPPTPPNGNTGSRALMALFMCITFFAPPSEYGNSGVSADHSIGPHKHEGRAMSYSNDNVIQESPNSLKNSFSTNDGTLAIDLWYLIRIFTFLLCFTYILRPSFFYNKSCGYKSTQVIASVLASKNKSAKELYRSLHKLASPIPSNLFNQIIGILTECFKLLIRRFIGWDISSRSVIHDIEYRPTEVGLWSRLGEVELSGGNDKVSRLSILYTCLRSINLLETCQSTYNSTYLSTSRIYADAAIQLFIGFQSIDFIAEKLASHFWQRAQNERNNSEEKWLEIALNCDQKSNIWRGVVNRIAEQALRKNKVAKETFEDIVTGTIPLNHISDAQALFHLKDAYSNFISMRHGKKKTKNRQSFSFDELLNVTNFTSLTHWYALVGCAVKAFSTGNNLLGEKLVNYLKEHYPKSDTNNNKQVIALGLFSYTLMMYGKVEASVRCAEKTIAAITRRNKEEKTIPEVSVFPDDKDYEINKIEREIHDLAEFCVGWMVLEARIFGWKIMEELVADKKDIKLPETLDIETRMKPGVQQWLLYMRRLSKVEGFNDIAKPRSEIMKQFHALSQLVGGAEECEDLGYEHNDQVESCEKREFENRASRAWSVLKRL
ncbi:hypothetical protein G9A89_019556 [Geosiphon pyriformis]|nr:hypothetical protein G9A89_019556 [Geosiphon pyriformis]